MNRKDELLRVYREHANIGYVPCLLTDANFLRHPKIVNERPEGHDGYDWFGVHWVYEEASNAPNPDTAHGTVITDITKWEEQVTFPDLSQYDWEQAAAEETAGWDRENKYSEVMLINGVFERSHHLLGFENALMAVYEEPEAYKALLHRIADYKCELIEYVAKYYKPDILMMHDDYGANDRLMLSPDTWREFIKPELARLVNKVHECGCIYEHHSCGHIEPIIGDLIEIGVDGINPLQRPCNDIARIKKEYDGKITFVGGLSTQTVIDRPGTTDEEIAEDLQYAYDTLAPGGGFVMIPFSIDMKKIAGPMVRKHLEVCRNYA